MCQVMSFDSGASDFDLSTPVVDWDLGVTAWEEAYLQPDRFTDRLHDSEYDRLYYSDGFSDSEMRSRVLVLRFQ